MCDNCAAPQLSENCRTISAPRCSLVLPSRFQGFFRAEYQLKVSDQSFVVDVFEVGNLNQVLDRRSASIPGPKLSLWADFYPPEFCNLPECQFEMFWDSGGHATHTHEEL